MSGNDARDHPQTTHLEPDARRADTGAGAGDPGEDPEQALPLGDATPKLSEGETEAVSRHARGFRTIGESVGSGAGLQTGSGTPADKGDLGGGGSGGGRG